MNDRINKNPDGTDVSPRKSKQEPAASLPSPAANASLMQQAVKTPGLKTLTPQTVIQLQRLYGNHHVASLLGRARDASPDSPRIQRTLTYGKKPISPKEAFDALKRDMDDDDDPGIMGQILDNQLEVILDYLDQKNYSFVTLSQLMGAVSNIYRQISHFDAASVNPETWAVLHRLRGSPDFMDFMSKKVKDVKAGRETYEAKDAKYNPDDYGEKKGHSWEGNAQWLEVVKGRKVILSEIPLKLGNVMRKRDASGKLEYNPEYGMDGKEKNVNEKYKNEVSAYAREIAYFLLNGYVGLWNSPLGGMPTFIMVPKSVIPREMVDSLLANRYVDTRKMNAVVNNGREAEDAQNLLVAFEIAGIPTELKLSDAVRKQKIGEAKASEERAAAMEDAVASRKADKQEKKEKRFQDALSKRVVYDPEAYAAWLLGKLKGLNRTYKQYNPSGPQMDQLLKEAIALEHVPPEYSKAAMKEFIAAKLRDQLPK